MHLWETRPPPLHLNLLIYPVIKKLKMRKIISSNTWGPMNSVHPLITGNKQPIVSE